MRQPSATFLIKPASAACNMSCSYCFYRDELRLRRTDNCGIMSPDLLETFVKKALREVRTAAFFVFQGGEPTLAGLDFYRKLIAFEKKYNERGVRIQNSIQTNGLLLDENWAAFLAANHFLVGLSLDGCRRAHDANRFLSDGRGSFDEVIRAADLLEAYRIPFNILSVVTAQSAKQIRKSYSFFREKNFCWQQYIPCLDPFGEKKGKLPYSLTAAAYGRFLKDLFDLWERDLKEGRAVRIRTFDNWLGILKGFHPEDCAMAGVCSSQWVIEADGSVYPCDFYALDEYKLGNLAEDSFSSMTLRRQELGFIEASAYIPEECQNCRWYFLCRNGCRRERDLLPDKKPGRNALCESYRDFFPYAFLRLSALAQKR